MKPWYIYISMATVPHEMIELQRMLDWEVVELWSDY